MAEAHRRHRSPPATRVKYGFGLNAKQEVGGGVRLFGGLHRRPRRRKSGKGSDGRNESYAYTKVDRSLPLGGDVKGDHRRPRLHKFVTALVGNRISGDQRKYLALGGHGSLLGDGGLSCGLEKIFEGRTGHKQLI